MTRRNLGRRPTSKGSMWNLAKVKTRVWVEVSPSIDGWANVTSVGVSLTQVHKWSGRLLQQVLYLWSDWLAIGPEARRATMDDFFQRPAKLISSVGVNGGQTSPEDMRTRSPRLARYMCDLVWGDGSKRTNSSLIVYVEGGQYKACLSDRDDDLSLWATSKTFEGILEVMEARLTEDVVDWRVARNRGKKR